MSIKLADFLLYDIAIKIVSVRHAMVNDFLRIATFYWRPYTTGQSLDEGVVSENSRSTRTLLV